MNTGENKQADFMILLFVTSVRHCMDKEIVTGVLDELVGEGRWFIDLLDVDKVLRVEARSDIGSLIIEALAQLGFECSVLFDND